MNKKSSLLFTVFLLLSLSVAGCAGRAPTAHSAASFSRGYFKNYGSKYKNSFFGQSQVKKVEINSIRELSKNMAAVDALVILENGQAARVLITARNKPPLGWSVSSWEMIESY